MLKFFNLERFMLHPFMSITIFDGLLISMHLYNFLFNDMSMLELIIGLTWLIGVYFIVILNMKSKQQKMRKDIKDINDPMEFWKYKKI